MVLSLVESTSVARTLGPQKGESLDASVEFVGQGWGNLAAACFSGYPISGSPSRSALNLRAGAKSRLASVFSGLFVLVAVWVGGDWLNQTPIACLAGLLVVLALGWWDTRSPLFLQERVGRWKRPFVLVKFRTMRPDTASVATHLVDASATTSLGRFLRRTKLDELPQLWNVLKGEMSLVGPRPCLFNQEVLIRERAARMVLDARPGITGLAQIQGVDMSMPKLLAEMDARMLATYNLRNYFRYILLTLLGIGTGDRISKC